jgi:hypothetical protein
MRTGIFASYNIKRLDGSTRVAGKGKIRDKKPQRDSRALKGYPLGL